MSFQHNAFQQNAFQIGVSDSTPAGPPPRAPLAAVAMAIVLAWTPPNLSSVKYSALTDPGVDQPPRINEALSYNNLYSLWQVDWASQRASRIAPLIPTLTTDQPIGVRNPAGLDQWQLVWGSQSASKIAPLTLVYGDQPVPRLTKNPQGIEQWQVSWNSQSEAPNASWNFTSTVEKVPYFEYPNSVWTSWQEQFKYGTYGSSVLVQTPGENPPGVRPEVPKAYWQWVLDWTAQKATSVASLIPPPVVSQVPYIQYNPIWIHYSWVLDWKAQSAGKLVQPSSGDNPPTVFPSVPVGYGQWIQDWKAQQSSQIASIIPIVLDVPPPYTQYNPAWINAQWQQDWRSQTEAAVAGIIPPPQVDNPPPKTSYQPYWLSTQWTVDWQAQSSVWNPKFPIPPAAGSTVQILSGVSFPGVGGDSVVRKNYNLIPLGGNVYTVTRVDSVSEDARDSVHHEEYIIT